MAAAEAAMSDRSQLLSIGTYSSISELTEPILKAAMVAQQQQQHKHGAVGFDVGEQRWALDRPRFA